MSSIYLSAFVHGTIKHGTPEVVISFYGPRGGLRSIESLSPAAARKLAHEILDATDE